MNFWSLNLEPLTLQHPMCTSRQEKSAELATQRGLCTLQRCLLRHRLGLGDWLADCLEVGITDPQDQLSLIWIHLPSHSRSEKANILFTTWHLHASSVLAWISGLVCRRFWRISLVMCLEWVCFRGQGSEVRKSEVSVTTVVHHQLFFMRNRRQTRYW